MIDINAIINTTIQQEVNKTITSYIDAYFANWQHEHNRQIETLKEEIAELKQQRAASPATGEGLAKDVVQDLLENNPTIKQAVYEIAHDAAEAVMADHLEGYDHDSYDSAASAVEDANLDSLPDFDHFLTRDDLENAIRDAISIDDFITKDDMSDAVRESVRETLENRVSVSLYLS